MKIITEVDVIDEFQYFCMFYLLRKAELPIKSQRASVSFYRSDQNLGNTELGKIGNVLL